MPIVSVIIPMYGVETFVGKCAESLLTQTLQDIELIFVDDASKDASVDIVESCVLRHTEFKGLVQIIHHEVNKGLPAARNTGLKHATGVYIFHCDGDDWMETDALEKMYSVAVESGADFVWCDWFLFYGKTERIMPQPDYSSKEDLLRNGMLGCGMKYNVWNKLVKRSLYTDNGISFPEGHSMGEDMTMIMLSSCASEVAHCPYPLYHYVRVNYGAMTQTLDDKKMGDIIYNVDRMTTFINGRFPGVYSREINWFKVNVKLPLLIEYDDMYDRWLHLFPESSRDCMSNRNVSLRTRAVEWLASHRCWKLIDLYKCAFDIIKKLLFEK